tara:strand:+ start:518 stop:925 length:408 start_codon:yes stop_codon:yes gene_type:complete
MKFKTFLDFLPINYRHEKSFLIEQKLLNLDELSKLSDLEINNIQINYPLCTLSNLKKIRAIAIFKKEIAISPPEAYLLLHCGIGSIKSLARSTPYELEQKIGRLKRNLKVKTDTNLTISVLKDWIIKANQIYKSI